MLSAWSHLSPVCDGWPWSENCQCCVPPVARSNCLPGLSSKHSGLLTGGQLPPEPHTFNLQPFLLVHLQNIKNIYFKNGVVKIYWVRNSRFMLHAFTNPYWEKLMMGRLKILKYCTRINVKISKILTPSPLSTDDICQPRSPPPPPPPAAPCSSCPRNLLAPSRCHSSSSCHKGARQISEMFHCVSERGEREKVTR